MISYIKFRSFLVDSFPPFFRGLLLVFVFAAFLCYFFVDYPLIETLAPYRKTARTVLKAASLLIFPPLHLLIWGIAFLWARFSYAKERFILPFFEIFAAQAISVAFVRVFKVLIGRARPECFLLYDMTGFEFFSPSHHFHSLPSGHTMAAMTLATSLALLFPKFRILSFTIALLLSFSRVFLLDHFPSDLFATGIFGIITAQVTHLVIKKITNYQNGEDLNHGNIPPIRSR
jgi:membrane-associated phospholipid phosphatase